MRGTFDPGYLNYTLGKLEILKLRDDYRRPGRARIFSLEKFHDEVLDHGMPPIRLLREILLTDEAQIGTRFFRREGNRAWTGACRGLKLLRSPSSGTARST